MKQPIIFSLFISSLFFTSNSFADFKIQFQTAHKTEPEQFLVKGNRVRIDHGKKPNSSYSIFDNKTKTFYIVDPKRKTYIEMNEETIKKQMAAVSSAMDSAKQQAMAAFKDMPPEQRAMMEKRFSNMGNFFGGGKNKDKPKPKVTVNKVGKKKVNDIPCSIYETYRGKKKKSTVCVAKPKDLKISDADYKTVKSMFNFSRKLANNARKMAGPAAKGMDAFSIKEFKGVPIETSRKKGKKITTLKTTSNKSLPAELFKLPEGFEKQTFDMPEEN